MKCTKHPEVEATGFCTACGKPFCADCLIEANGKMICRDDISNIVSDAKEQTQAGNNQNTIVNVNTNVSANAGINYVQKSKITAIILCLFFGFFGVHRFYVGKSGSGILYLFTGGLFGIGWFIDIILLITGGFRDSAGYPLK